MEMVHTGSVSADIGNPAATAKSKFAWTRELHFTFMDVIIILGGLENKDAVPNGILRLMNVPGLTRDHVASHLQKVRQLENQLKKTGRPQRMNKTAKFHKQWYNSYGLPFGNENLQGENDIYTGFSPNCYLPEFDNNTVGQDNSSDNHMVNLTNDFNYQLNIYQCPPNQHDDEEDFFQSLFA